MVSVKKKKNWIKQEIFSQPSETGLFSGTITSLSCGPLEEGRSGRSDSDQNKSKKKKNHKQTKKNSPKKNGKSRKIKCGDPLFIYIFFSTYSVFPGWWSHSWGGRVPSGSGPGGGSRRGPCSRDPARRRLKKKQSVSHIIELRCSTIIVYWARRLPPLPLPSPIFLPTLLNF